MTDSLQTPLDIVERLRRYYPSNPEKESDLYRTIREAADEIERLRKQLARANDDACEMQRVSFEWMKKHDRLLAFIQKRPTVLKELIEDDNVRAND